jgi:transposase-like protein
MFVCKHCNKTGAVKAGLRKNKSGWVQKYFCSDCKKYFVDRKGFENYRTNSDVITAALDLRAKGLSLRDVVDHLDQHYRKKVSRQTVLNWQNKFGKKLKSFTQTLNPFLGGIYHADEMFTRVSGNWNYLWSCIDWVTKFLVENHFSDERNDKECIKFIGKIKSRTEKPPDEIHTDNSWDYYPAFRKHFPRNRKIHKHFPAWRHKFKNNPIERYFNTVKQRYKTFRGFDNTKSAEQFFDFFTVYYNFIRKHMTLQGKTPAQAAKINLSLGRNRFKSLIELLLAFFKARYWSMQRCY